MTFKTAFVIMGLILAVPGRFLLGVMLVGRVGIEGFLQSAALIWGFRILIVGFAIILAIKREWLTRVFHGKRSRMILLTFYGVGFIGWLWGIIDLLV